MDTWDNLYNFFLGRVRDKLHVCLCFSPVGAKFSRRAQQFPGLINGCTIDWFLSWPEEALTSVSGKFIDEFPMACPDTVKDSLKAMMGQVHVNVTAACQEYFEKFRRHVYVTPKSYLSFIAGYKSLYEKKLVYVRDLATSINSGLSKMGEAKVDVNKMKGELAIKNTDLAAATKEAEKLLKEISENTAIAEKEKQKVMAASKKHSEISSHSTRSHLPAVAMPCTDQPGYMSAFAKYNLQQCLRSMMQRLICYNVLLAQQCCLKCHDCIFTHALSCR